LWWPQRKTWLLRSRVTLDICGVQADSKLQFTPKHKNVHLQTPDLQFVDTTIDFSKKVFHAVTEVCTHFGIRHAEELSLLRPPAREKKEKRTPRKSSSKRRGSQGSEHSNNSDEIQTAVSADGRLAVPGKTGSIDGASQHSASTPGSPKSHGSFDSYETENHILASSPSVHSQEVLETIYKAKTLNEKIAFHAGYVCCIFCLFYLKLLKGLNQVCV
jgi:kindlin 2